MALKFRDDIFQLFAYTLFAYEWSVLSCVYSLIQGWFLMFLLFCLLMGGGLILVTVIVHAIVYDWVLKFLPRTASLFAKYFGKFWKINLLTFIVLCVLVALFIDIWLWTFLLMIVDTVHLPDIETGLYFATTSFTTVGYGDIVLQKHWRLLGTICAINGMFLFGWSAAFIYEIMEKLYQGEQLIKKKWRE